MADLFIKVGDTRPWTSNLTSAGDDDLTDASTVVKVYMRLAHGSTSNKIDGTSAAMGTKTTSKIPVTYSPSSTDVDTAGDYLLYWKVTFTAGSKLARWPSHGHDKVFIQASFE